jgi:hypothetical protein
VRVRRLLAPLATPLKLAALALVLVRFHGSWIGLTVALALAALLFGVDRSVRRWGRRAIGR